MTDFEKPWGKTDRASDAWHSVIAHCIDVAVTAGTLMRTPVLHQRLSAAFGIELSDVHLQRLSFLAGLHDAGKTLVGFQGKLSQSDGVLGSGHVREMLCAITKPDVQRALRVDMLSMWFDDISPIFHVAICHHGSPVAWEQASKSQSTVSKQLCTTVYGHQPLEELKHLATALLDVFPLAQADAPPLTVTPSSQHLFAGLVMTADWMGSSTEWFPYANGDDDDRHVEAQQMAQFLLADVAFSGWANDSRGSVLGEYSPRPSQSAMQDLSVEERIVALEDQTGAGKTEAAMIHAQRLAEAGRIDAVYFAVPSRSAATELHSRIARAASDVWPAVRNRVVRAVPGLIDTTPGNDMHDDHDHRSWAIGCPKRVFAAPIAVGTIDQAMLSCMRVKHSWLRAALLSRALLIIDECHASDPYMTEIIGALVRRHMGLGGYVLLMSATLGEAMKAELLGPRRRRSIEEALGDPYPAITTSDTTTGVESTAKREVRVDVLHEDVVHDEVMTAANAGASVLVIRSTVGDAVAMYQRFQGGDVPILLHHSRWADHDRRILDGQVFSHVGKDADRGGVIIVGTQTVEQSLDIDADLLVTDACPADVLLQRLGRLHRHTETSRVAGYETPRCLVIDPGPLNQYLSAKGDFRGREGQGWPWVYGNGLAVQQTLAWIKEHGGITTPDDNREMVELATHTDHLQAVAEQLGDDWVELWTRLYGAQAEQRALARAALVDWGQDYEASLVDERQVTRLGLGTIDLDVNVWSPLDATPIRRLPVPMQWMKGIEPDEPIVCEAQTIRVGTLDLEYGSLGLQKAT